MRPIFLLLLLIAYKFSHAQNTNNSDLDALRKTLTSKVSGWKFIDTHNAAYADGPGYYFYFDTGGNMLIYSQEGRNDPNPELICKTSYALFKFSDGQKGISISNFYGEIKLFVRSAIAKNALKNTNFYVYYKGGSLELINYPQGTKEYFINKFF